MKMIKLLVLRNGNSMKVPQYTNTGKAFVGDSVIGAVYSVSKDVYKGRHTPAIKKLLVDSIDSPTLPVSR